jgi:hypothetical protein
MEAAVHFSYNQVRRRGPARSKKAAERCTELNWTVGPTLIVRRGGTGQK